MSQTCGFNKQIYHVKRCPLSWVKYGINTSAPLKDRILQNLAIFWRSPEYHAKTVKVTDE